MPTDVPNSDQGTSGAPPSPEGAGGSGSLSAQELTELLNAPDPQPGAPPPTEEFKDLPWDKVQAAVRAGKAPEDFKKTVELPFLQEFTRKSQAFSREKEALMASMIDKLASRGVAPTVEEKDELREKLKEGGLPLELLDQYIERKMAPVVNDVSSTRMEQLAIAMEPAVEKRREEIAAYIRENPSTARLILANNGRDGHEVIARVAQLLEYQQLKAEKEQFEQNLPKLRLEIAKEVIATLKKTGQVLPSSTSRAGTGPTGETKAEYSTFKEAALAAARSGNFPL